MSGKNLKSKQSGVQILEFAFVLPILLLVVFGIINYGCMMYDQAIITNAAREGARWGSINTTSASTDCSSSTVTSGTPSTICDVINIYLNNFVITFNPPATITMSATSSGSGSTKYTQGQLITVTVSYPFGGVGYLGNTLFSSTLTAKSIMYHE